MSSKLSFEGRVVVVTGAGGGLGKVYALEYAKRGAKVVVNDLGGSLGGSGHDKRAADLVVGEIRKSGGTAVANYDSVSGGGSNIVKTAIDHFGRVDVVINNAGILRDVSFAKMSAEQFAQVVDVHLNGAYELSHAAWPYMLKQKFGRIINTASPAGLYGNFGQANYAAAKLGLVGLAETLSKEGLKYDIRANVIAPLASSRMTEDILPAHILKQLGPEKIAPLVLYLTHESCKVTNSIFELAGGWYGQIRWERSSGQIFNPNEETLTPEALLHKWGSINDFTDKPFKPTEHPIQLADYNDLITKARNLPKNNDQGTIKIKSLQNKVVIITGAGGGLGRSHANWFARYGAKVVVNDIKSPKDVVQELNNKYGEGTAVSDTHNIITEAPLIVETALRSFGHVDVLVNNAGILRDRSFKKMVDSEWNAVLQVHLFATFAMCKAVWPVFMKQKSGYILNVTSTTGIYGNFGQANYSAAKSAILGFSKTIAIEGASRGIIVNVIAPHAETAMTRTIFRDTELKNHFDPSQVSPLFVLLASEELQRSKGKIGVRGELFEVGGGWVGRTRFQRSAGFAAVASTKDNIITPELIRENWSKVVNFSNPQYPSSFAESSALILRALQAASSPHTGNSPTDSKNTAKSTSPDIFVYTDRDSILYNLGLGAKSNETQYVYENDPHFQVLPSFAVIPFMHNVMTGLNMGELVDNFDFSKLLHGEQYFKLFPPTVLATHRSVRTIIKPLQVLDKGSKGAVVVGGSETFCTKTNKLLATNEGTFFIRGATARGSKARSLGARAKFATMNFKPPQGQSPDAELDCFTSRDQAALYRLSGDYNPLHIDPKAAKAVGFPRPILHGLCTLGITVKALYEHFGAFSELKLRFTSPVFPGDHLKVRVWKQANGTVIFQTVDVTRNVVVLDNAAIHLVGSDSKF
ncbi:FOX2 (YKR009C) [Zygosaccharomyces parabailii]|nr:FOX2 (YKR009C) [Zygosaccharomyces parabailii]